MASSCERGIPMAYRQAKVQIYNTTRQSKYLNNLAEQDHRRVKQRERPMLGFQRFDCVPVTLAGIELVHQIKQQQFDVSASCPSHARTPQGWEAVLAA